MFTKTRNLNNEKTKIIKYFKEETEKKKKKKRK